MEELWREVSELMGRRPLLWLPVLIADLLGSFVNLARGSLLHAYVVSHVQPHSVLGGGPLRGAPSASVLEAATAVAICITWGSYFVRMLLYPTALVATAALVRSFAERVPNAFSSLPVSLRRQIGSIVGLALRALPIYVAGALLLAWLVRWMLGHGHQTTASSGWLLHALELLLLIALSAFLPGPAVRALAGRQPREATVRRAQIFSFLLGLASLAIASFIGANSGMLSHLSPVPRFTLQTTGSLLVALPFVPMFLGLSLLARQEAREGAQSDES